MNNRTIFILIIVIVVLVGGFLWLSPFSKPSDDNTNNPSVGGDFILDKIVANHFFENGIHTVDGSVSVPTPCHELSVTSSKDGDAVTLAFVTQSTSELCTQVVAEKFFSVNFEAPENATISATWNGAPITIELVKGAEGDAVQKL